MPKESVWHGICRWLYLNASTGFVLYDRLRCRSKLRAQDEFRQGTRPLVLLRLADIDLNGEDVPRDLEEARRLCDESERLGADAVRMLLCRKKLGSIEDSYISYFDVIREQSARYARVPQFLEQHRSVEPPAIRPISKGESMQKLRGHRREQPRQKGRDLA
jgi:hypothetical protein